MRILLASKRAPATPGRRDGGVQTWVSTVAAELRRIGHEVDVVAGAAWDVGTGFDVGIFANANYTAGLADRCRTSLLVCHGIVPDEAPTGDFDEVAFTSEEVRDCWGGDGPVIRQPIDLEFWSPGVVRAGGTLVRYANRGGLEWLPAVADRLGLEFRHVRNATPADARAALRHAAVVLASGRCAVEAMACGAPVVVCDERHYQGPLLDHPQVEAMQRNYSGRGGRGAAPEDVVWAALDGMHVGTCRTHVERHHDVRKIVPQLLEAACCTC